ncbi:putative Ankyrin [Seiridium unicorne]|uniref:Ankyrin n=1 Tax=Seiridium unicorne TaxID=138068 RepID=A0ABR2UZ48_9PEZI
MADPLSIAASIAGVITLADVVFTRLIKYTKQAKEAQQEIKDLAAEINSIGGSLNSLSRLARALSDESFDPTLRIEHIAGCHNVLSRMEEKLRKAEGDLAKPDQLSRVQRKLKWPFSAARMEELQSALSRHHQSINLALSADCLNSLLLHLTTSRDLVTEVKELRRITARIEENEERRRVLDYFMKSEPQRGYETSLSLRHPRTGLWLLRLPQVQTWLDLPGSRIWLTGIPGAGKTVLAASIIEAALGRSSEKIAVGFFFCDYKEETTHVTTNVLGALVSQLALQNDAAYALLAQYYQDLHPLRGLPRGPTVDGLQDLLTDIAQLFDHTFLIVDGLDECGKHTDDVVDALKACAQTEKISTALLSRDENNIRNCLENDFGNIEISAHDDDITEYVTSEIEERIRTKRIRIRDPSLKGEILHRLVDGASGMFRWVACQLDHLKLCLTDKECREALKTLPPDLTGTYTRILKRIPVHHSSLAVMILNFIAYANPALSLLELKQAVSVSEGDGFFNPADLISDDTIFHICSSLVRTSTDSAKFEFAHFSVQEFLESNHLLEAGLGNFAVSASRCSRLLATQSLHFIQLRDFGNDMSKNDDLKALLNERKRKFPFYTYASTRWFRYARDEWDSAPLMDITKKLFDPRKTSAFVNWAYWLWMECNPNRMLAGCLETLLEKTFRPIHLAAMLHLVAICHWLTDVGRCVNIKSAFGTPFQCSVAGASLLCNNAFLDEWYLPALSKGIRADSTGDTIQCILSAGGSCCDIYPTDEYASLIAGALSISLKSQDFSGIPVLIAHGVHVSDKDVQELEKCLVNGRYYLEECEVLCRQLIQDLSQLINTEYAPAALSVCSSYWKRAMTLGWSFAMNPELVNSQVSMTKDELLQWGFTAAKMGDVESIAKFLQDPRTDVKEMRCPIGYTVLHYAVQSYDYQFTFEGSNLVCKRLLDAGCDPSSLNGHGDTPLHLWDWEEQDVLEQQLADLVEAFVRAGVDITIQNLSGHNVLHSIIIYPWELQAILNHAERSQVVTALQAVDNDGYTPLTKALRQTGDAYRDVRLETSAILLFQASQDLIAKWNSPVPILELAACSGSELVIQMLLESSILSDKGTVGNPFRNLGACTTARSVQLLCVASPGGLDSLENRRCSLQSFLANCLKYCGPLPHSFRDAVIEIVGSSSDSAMKDDGLIIWEYIAAVSVPNMKKKPKSDQGGPNLKLCLDVLIDLGCLNAYENESNKSGLVALLQNFGFEFRQLEDCIWPIHIDTIRLCIANTRRWPEFLQSASSAGLLLAAFRSNNLQLFQLLIEKGAKIGRKLGSESLLELMMSHRLTANAETSRAMFKIVLKHVNSRNINYINPQNGLGLIHRLAVSNNGWQIEQLLELGADPNLHGGIQNRSTPALVYHILQGSSESAMVLLRNGADPTAQGASGFDAALAAAFVAAEFGQLAVIHHLHQHGIDINSTSMEGQVPLHFAVMRQQIEAIKVLVELGAKNIPDQHDTTPLTLAYNLGFQSTIDCISVALSESSAYWHPESTKLLSLNTTRNLAKAFSLALRRGQLEFCKNVHNQGCPVDIDLICGGCSPLLEAIRLERTEIVEWLLDHGALTTKITCKAQGFRTVIELLLMCRTRDPRFVGRIVDMYSRDGGNLRQRKFLLTAIQARNLTGLRILLETMTVEAYDGRQMTETGGVESLHGLIISNGTRSWAPFHSPLQYAIQTGQREAVEMLLSYTSGDLPIDLDPTLIFHVSLEGGVCKPDDILKDILNSGACIDSRNAFGWTRLMRATASNEHKTIQSLMGANSDWRITGTEGSTILHAAAIGQNLPAFVDFVSLGANPLLVDAVGLSALHLAATWNVFTSLLLNGNYSIDVIGPFPSCNLNIGWRVPHLCDMSWLNHHFRLYRRKMMLRDLQRMANLEPGSGWSLLCKLSVLGNIQAMENLISIGANIEHEGSSDGSALMAACRAGNFTSVRFLVRKGASLSYTGAQGHRSAVHLARRTKRIVKWILVDRFSEQHKISMEDCEAGSARLNEAIVPWSGAKKTDFLILGENERRSTESSFEYYKRLMNLKHSLRGKVLPLSIRGRTSLPSKMIPEEIVRVSPGDRRVAR